MPHWGTVRRSIGLLAVIAVTALAACSEDDGVSLLEPGRDLQGLWVRWQPPLGLPVASVRPMYDTLFLGNDGSGVWSREIPSSAGIEPLRVTQRVQVETRDVVLLLYPFLQPCDVCRLASVPTDRPYGIRRTDADHLELVRPGDPTAEHYHYERRPFVGPMPD